MLKLFRKIIELFRSDKSDKSQVAYTVSYADQSRKNKKSKKNKGRQVFDSSIDNSTTVAGDGNVLDSHNVVGSHNVTETNNYYGSNPPLSDLVVAVRWLNLVPHRSHHEKSGIADIYYLEPIDPNYIKPTFNVVFSEQYNERNALYVLVQRNPYIKNLKLKSIKLSLDTCQYESTDCKDLVGLVDTPKAFAVQCSDFRVGSGKIFLTFRFEKEGRHFLQEFVFDALNDSNEFVMREYPVANLDFEHFTF